MTTTNASAPPPGGLSSRQLRVLSTGHAIDLLQLQRVDDLGRDEVGEAPTGAVLAVDGQVPSEERRALRRVATVLPHLPSLRAAIEEGRTSFAAATHVCRAASRQRLTVGHLRLLDRQLADLLAVRRDVDDLLDVVRDRVHALRPDADQQAEDAVVDRVELCPRLFGGGMVVLDATTETYELVVGAIDKVVARDLLLDRSRLQRDDGSEAAVAQNHDVRAEARGAAVRKLAAEALSGRTVDGTVRPPRPSLQVVVPLDALTGDSDEPARLLTGGRMTAGSLRRLVDTHGADVTAVVLDDDGEQGSGAVVGVGRRQRVAPGWLDRLTRTLQPRCVVPGCRVRVTDLDHATRWADGGATDLDNLSRLCRRHHVEKDRDRTWRLEPDATGAVTVVHAGSGWRATTRPWPTGPPAPPRTVTRVARRDRQPRLPFAPAQPPTPRSTRSDGLPF